MLEGERSPCQAAPGCHVATTHSAAFGNQTRLDYSAFFRQYAGVPNRQQGAYLMTGGGYTCLDLKPPTPLVPGDYTLRGVRHVLHLGGVCLHAGQVASGGDETAAAYGC